LFSTAERLMKLLYECDRKISNTRWKRVRDLLALDRKGITEKSAACTTGRQHVRAPQTALKALGFSRNSSKKAESGPTDFSFPYFSALGNQ
jgi:hypothetical protein